MSNLNATYDLVFSGASTKIAAHIGALSVLEDHNFRFGSFIGTSAGSIIAACKAIGMNYKEMYDIISKINYSDIVEKDKSMFSRILTTLILGFSSTGDRLYDILKKLYGDLKFRDLDKDLLVVAQSLDNWNITVFSRRNTPNVKICDAVRASSSLPFLFKPFHIGNKFYIDGGIGKHFPVDLNVLNRNIIGSLIISEDKTVPRKGCSSIDIAKSIIDSLSRKNIYESINRAKKLKLRKFFYCKIVSNLSAFDFDLTQRENEKLFQNGKLSMEKLIKEQILL